MSHQVNRKVTVWTFSQIDNFFETEEEMGDEIDDKLSQITNKALKNKCNEENLKDLKKKYKRPKNVEYLQVPKV